ncbi:MAG: acetylglutamate kinase [Caulobacteraceae bacterium]
MSTPSETAGVIVRVLPYIRRFAGKAVVVKLGGAAMTDPDLNRTFAEDMLLLRSVGVRPVVVHGGGPQIGALMERLGKTPEFRQGQRVTDAETLDIARMVLVGKINREIVAAINRDDGLAVGLSGEDAGLITAVERDADLGFVGDVSAVNPGILHKLLNEGLIPVVSTIGRSLTGQAYNINADAAAAAIAVALEAEKIIYLTGAPGLLRDASDPASLVSRLSLFELKNWIAAEAVDGGMIPKLQACADAVGAGVASAHILDGRTPHTVLIELFTDEGIGTMIERGEAA